MAAAAERYTPDLQVVPPQGDGAVVFPTRRVHEEYADIRDNVHDTKLDTGVGALGGAFVGFAVTGGNPLGAGVGALVGGVLGYVKSRLSLRDTEQKAENVFSN